jgi:hypothetical protein
LHRVVLLSGPDGNDSHYRDLLLRDSCAERSSPARNREHLGHTGCFRLGYRPCPTARLILKTAPNVRDAYGWADDVLHAFSTLSFEANRENVCSVTAVIRQE